MASPDFDNPNVVVAYMQGVYAGMSAITRAPTEFPGQIPESYLPFAWTSPRKGPVNLEAALPMWETDFITDVLVFPLSRASQYTSGAETTNTLLRDILATWTWDRSVGGTVKSMMGLDGEIQVIDWNNTPYYGCTVTLTALMPLPMEV